MAIAKLPEEVRSAVRNGIAIASTAQCVAELVYNALDADADSIIIHLDIPQYKLQVFDNGSGITLDNLKNCGLRYNTSKCRSLSDIQSHLKYYGYRGEALASIVASSSTIIILTRPKSDAHTYCKTFLNGKAHHPTRSITSRTCPGTTITVQNFMYNAPVRQQRIKPNIDVEEIRMQVEGLALAHPHVSFTIQDESDNSTVLNISRSQSTLEAFSKLYGEETTGNLFPAGPLESGKHKLHGFISKSSYHNKKLQFVFVNGKLVKKTKVHKLINMIMRKSDILRVSGPWQDLPMPERVRDFLWVSPMKKRDRYCVFLINIDCPPVEYDMTLDPDKTLIEFRDWDSLLEGTENLVKDFLKKHNLAFVASDPENGNSEEESPTSVLEEVRKLDEEGSVRNKLERFKHDSAKQGDMDTFTARTIRSIPAKRFISSKKKNKSGKRFWNKNRTESVPSKVQTDATECQIKNHGMHSNLQSFVDKSSCGQRENPEVNTSANVTSSLSKFRELFNQKDPVPLKTPADQIIKLEEPPPIIRRKNPLEHRIKALYFESEKTKTSQSTMKLVTSKTANADLIENEVTQKNFPEKDSNPIEKPTDINSKAKCLENAPPNVEKVSGYFKKVIPVSSVATQTVNDFAALKPFKQTNANKIIFDKPNLRNISLWMRQRNESLPNGCKSTLLNNYGEEENVDDPLRDAQVDFLTLSQSENANAQTKTSKDLSHDAVNPNLPSSTDMICTLPGKDISPTGEAMTDFEKTMNVIPFSQNEVKSFSATDNINHEASDREKHVERCRSSNVVPDKEEMNNSSNIHLDLSNQRVQSYTESNDDHHEKQSLNCDSATNKKHGKTLETSLEFENLADRVSQMNSDELAIESSNDCERDYIESGYTSDSVKIVSPFINDEFFKSEVIEQDYLKSGQKRPSKNDDEMKCIIKKAHLEIHVDSNQCNSLKTNEFKSVDGMEIESHSDPNDHEVQESGFNPEEARSLKDEEIAENEMMVSDDLWPGDMNDEEKIDCSSNEINKNDAENMVVGNNLEKESTFEMFARTPFLPKGLSPLLAKDIAKLVTLGKNSAKSNKVPISENLHTLDSGVTSAGDYALLIKKLPSDESSLANNSENDTNKTGLIASHLSELENKKYIMESKVMNAFDSTQNKSIMKIFNLMYPCTFSKSVIAKFKMLGRLDNKFIVAQINTEEKTNSGSLVLFDQHAVHERIRLERLLKEYTIQNEDRKSKSSSSVSYKSVPIVPPLEVTATASEVRIMGKFTEHFERLGLSFEECPGNEDKNEEIPVRITSIPACLSSKDAKELGPLGLKERIRGLIREQTENLVTTRGLGTFSPEVLRDAINMEACRGAVKFGDVLSDHQCRWLLRNLAKCDSPFQCAHGRPSLYPIAAISHLEKHWSQIELEKPCLQKINKLLKLSC